MTTTTAEIGERLCQSAASGALTELQGVYDEAATLHAYVPGGPIVCTGERDILAELGRWWPSPAHIALFEQEAGLTGTTLCLERHPTAPQPPSRQSHLVHVEGGHIARHIVYSDRPRLATSDPPPLPFDDVIQRTPLAADGAYSGSLLEYVVVRDGRRVVKHLSPTRDWIMRATHDHGREATLWCDGLYERLAPAIEVPIIDAVRTADGWVLVMDDVFAELSATGHRLTRRDARRLFRAARTIHDTCRSNIPDGLSMLDDRLRLFSQATAEREAMEPDLAPKQNERVWELFADVAPPDIVDVVLRLHEDPTPLTTELLQCDRTLLHGDLKPANIGLPPDRVVMLDWQLAAEGPPAIDFIWALNFLPRFDATLDELIEDIRTVSGQDHDERALQLAVIFHMAMAASGLVVDLVDDPDEGVRRDVAVEFDWWVNATRNALDTTWQPPS